MNHTKFRALLFVAASFFIFFFLASAIPLWSSDEGRFAEIARAMHVSGDWIVPFFNGLPYLEKPALAPWLTALAFNTLGTHALAARLPGILSALAGLLITYLGTKRLLGKSAAYFAALCLLTSAGYVLVGRFAVIDMEMIFLLSASLFLAVTGFFEQNNLHYLLSAVLMGLTFLAKGLIGAVLPAAIFFIFLLSVKQLKELKKIHIWVLMLLIFTAIIAPWLGAILKKQPEFLNVFIFEHHFKRFATATFGRKRPLLFFTYILPVICFPWSIFIPASIAAALKASKQNKDRLLFFVIWTAVIFIFFSIPSSKLPYYITPVAVPIAVLVGFFLSQWVERKDLGVSNRWVVWSWKAICVVCLLGAAGLSGSLIFADRIAILQMMRELIPFAALILGIGGITTFYFFNSDRRAAAVTALAATSYCALIVVFFCMLRLSPFQSCSDFAALIHENSKPDDLVAVYGSPDRYSDLPFYLEKRIIIVGSDRGTLTRESFQEENKAIATGGFYDAGDFVKLMLSEKGKRVYCLLEKKRLKELQDLGLAGFRTWAEIHGRILISNI